MTKTPPPLSIKGIVRQIPCHRSAAHSEPFSLVHFLTERCNARCRHCFIDFENPLDPGQELTLTEIGHLTKTLGKTLYNVNLTGGEPFLRTDLVDIVRCYTENTSIRSIVITTNGWFTDRIVDLVRRFTKLDTTCTLTISISLDDREHEHDEGRNLPGLHARALASYRVVKGIAADTVRADIALTVTDRNAPRMAAIFDDLVRQGVSGISPVLVRSEGVQQEVGNRDAFAEAYRLLGTLTGTLPKPVSRTLARALHRGKNRVSRDIIYESCRTGRFIAPCRAGSLLASIAADGTVYPCELLTARYPLGNLRDHTMNFMSIWNSAAAKAARQAIHENRCHCTFECAWTVNILFTPSLWGRLLTATARELL